MYYNIWYFYLFQDPESQRKTVAEGLLDTGFLIAQANLLKEIVSKGAEHYTVLLTLLIISIVLQAVVAILLGILGTWHPTMLPVSIVIVLCLVHNAACVYCHRSVSCPQCCLCL